MSKRLSAVMIAVAVVTLMVTVMWANIRTYYVGSDVATDTVIWNDRQLVLFIMTSDSGTSMKMFEAVPGAAKRLLGSWGAPQHHMRQRVTIVRYEDGVVTRTLVNRSGQPYPRFVEGRPYLLGGVWTGQQVTPIAQHEQRRINAHPEAPGDIGEWRRETTLFWRSRAAALDVPVRVGGETMSLRATRTGDEFAIDLIRKPAPPLRLWSTSTAGRSVSAGEYERLFQGTSDGSPGRSR